MFIILYIYIYYLTRKLIKVKLEFIKFRLLVPYCTSNFKQSIFLRKTFFLKDKHYEAKHTLFMNGIYQYHK